DGPVRPAQHVGLDEAAGHGRDGALPVPDVHQPLAAGRLLGALELLDPRDVGHERLHLAETLAQGAEHQGSWVVHGAVGPDLHGRMLARRWRRLSVRAGAVSDGATVAMALAAAGGAWLAAPVPPVAAAAVCAAGLAGRWTVVPTPRAGL